MEHEDTIHHKKETELTIALTPVKIFSAGLILGLLIMGVPGAFLWAKVGQGTGSTLTGTIGDTVPSAARQPQAAGDEPKLTGPAPQVGKDDYIFGDKNAQVTIIEYSDLECPYCKTFHPTVKQVVADSKGKVNWVYRHFPLPFHNPGAQKEAEAAECAGSLGGSKKFYEFIDKVFERTTSNGTGFPITNLVPLAKELGLNEKKFQDCLDGGKMTQKVIAQRDAGSDAGINGTPGNILLTKDGKSSLVAGALGADELKARIDALLK